MRRKSKIALAALAGAGSILMAKTHVDAALVVTFTEAHNVMTQDGPMDRYVFNLTAFTDGDQATGPLGQDAEILLFEGTWSAVGPGAAILVPGANSNPGAWTNYITAQSTGTAQNPPGDKSSFVNLPSLFSTPSRTGTGTATATTSGAVTAINGTSASFTGHWFLSDPTTEPGPAGGIEPSVNSGKLATIYVTPGAGLSFVGDYGTYHTIGGNAVVEPESFATVPEPASTFLLLGLPTLLLSRRRHTPCATPPQKR